MYEREDNKTAKDQRKGKNIVKSRKQRNVKQQELTGLKFLTRREFKSSICMVMYQN